jgi:hypothetical protein
MAEITRCPRCGNVLSGDLGGRCPECLLQAGMMASSEGASDPATIDYPRDGSTEKGPTLPKAGQEFGGYHLIRALGQGGMGTVFEAEERGTGRRLALKVLSHSLNSPTARQRFFREGRLAASVNHPHSVYVFGTEEIEGAPVITMELVQGGTLQDRVRRQGPLPIAEAVDATLQIIDGLEAAHAVGVLHRDVKPSNCFVDADGQVKIGDFGLSISKVGRGDLNLTSSGVFLGTPTFASPEQLRGDELDKRSDLYAVGVTLYYLLTGKVPFEADQMVQLVALVLEKPTPDVRALRPETPRELAGVLQGCLEKAPARRYRSYAELRTALLPFSTIVPTPVNPAWRFWAGAIDVLILLGVQKAFWSSMEYLEIPATVWTIWPWNGLEIALAVAVSILYYIVPEGLLGATIGKRLLGMRVVRRAAMQPPGLLRSIVRTAVYNGIQSAPAWLLTWLMLQRGWGNRLFESLGIPELQGFVLITSGWLIAFSSFLAWALLFSTMRKRNGFSGLHDLLSGTRVIFRPRPKTRPMATLATLAVDNVQPGAAQVGPYHVLSLLVASDAGEWHLGFDSRLLRKVWIHIVPAGTPAVAAVARNQTRSSRLRWLTGQRGTQDNWDVYEAPTGQALWDLLEKPHEWDEVRYWLLDLSEELAAALKNGSLPPVLGLDRVWITAEGRAKILDLPAPGLATLEAPTIATQPGEIAPVREFLHLVAAAALRGQRLDFDQARQESFALPLPLYARPIVEGLSKVQRPEVIAVAIGQHLDKPTRVTRARRLSLLAVCVALPILVSSLGVLSIPSIYWDVFEHTDLPVLHGLLFQYANPIDGIPPEQKAAVATYITGHFGERIKNPAFWENRYAAKNLRRQLAEEIVARTPAPSSEELAQAAKIAFPDGGDPLEDYEGSIVEILAAEYPYLAGLPGWLLIVALLAFVFGIVLVVFTCVSSIVCALLFRGGLLWRLFNIDAVTKDGQQASRWRLTWRQLVAWSPFLIFYGLSFPSLEEVPWYDRFLTVLGLVCLSVIVISAFLKRGLSDRLAGTWLVIR